MKVAGLCPKECELLAIHLAVAAKKKEQIQL
jgi:hypothetical protein